MPSDHDLLFGKIAIELKFCTDAQVEKCVSIQASSKAGLALGRHLVDEGFLSEDQHAKVLEVQRRRMLHKDPISQSSKEEVLFGRLAVREGLLTSEQMNACLRLQGSPGEKRTLGEILVAEGLLSSSQIKALLAQQSKKIMSCPKCLVSFTVHTISHGKTISCPRCKGPLREGKPSDSVRTDAELHSDSALRKLLEARPEPPVPPPRGAAPAKRCRICQHPFVGPLRSDGRVECLSCHARFIP